MDATFFEKQPFFPITNLQWEKVSEDNSWETETPLNVPHTSQPPSLLSPLAKTPTIEPIVPPTLNESSSGGETNSLPTKEPQQPKLRVYSRR